MSSIAEKSLHFCQLFEAELLLELMLRQWDHPLADDGEYRSQLLETTTRVLEEAARGTSFIESVAPSNMNFVAALYYAETRACEDSHDSPEVRPLRENWLRKVRHCLPSCFCDPSLLD